MSNPFKPGDQVQCVDDSWPRKGQLVVGHVYVVKKIAPHDQIIVENLSHVCATRRFVHVNDGVMRIPLDYVASQLSPGITVLQPDSKPCTCDFTGPNCWLGCRCGSLQKESA